MQAHSTLVLGAASWNRLIYVDTLPQGVSATVFEALEAEAAGSTGVGKAFALHALGHAPVLHCALGADAHGEQVRAACAARGVAMIVDTQAAPTPHHLNIMDRHGGRYSLFLSNGAAAPEIDRARLAQAIAGAQTIFLSLCASSKVALPLLAGTEAEVLLDLHDYDGRNPWHEDFIAAADVIQLSNVALPDPEPVIARLLAGRARQVVLTKADKGAEIVTDKAWVQVPVCPAEMVDSNGAGDAFSVALWHGQRAGLGLAQAGRFAAAAAAFAVEDATLVPVVLSEAAIRVRAGLGDVGASDA